MNVRHLDHLVLTVENIDKTCRFYSKVLGMKVVGFGDGRKALCFGNQKINLHQRGKELSPAATNPTPGAADLCFITETPLSAVISHLQEFNLS